MAVSSTPAPAGTGTPIVSPGVAGAVAPATVPRSRVARFRRRLLLALVLGSLAAVATGAVVLAANVVTYDRYHAIVHEGAVSVDAAQDARAAALDSAAANADLLAQTDLAARDRDRATAAGRWADFKNALRISWQNRSDTSQGEFAVFAAADTASTDYEGWIGAMNAALGANRPDDAHTAFLNAYGVLHDRLIPALNGLQAVKVEFMKSEYASASSTIRGWLTALAVASVVLMLIAGFGFWLTRRMHHRFTVELILAILLVAGIGAWVGLQLHRGDTQARVLVHDAYDTVAGVRDEIALASEEHALESITIFDPAAAAGRFQEFGDYDLQFEQGLCGFAGCAQTPFLAGGATAGAPQAQVAPEVFKGALDAADRFGLARPPLIANVHFRGEPQALESARAAYQKFVSADGGLRTQLQGGNTSAALAANTGQSTPAFQQTVQGLDGARSIARSVYDSIWRSVQDAARIGEFLAIGEVIAGLLIATGLWRRRQELYPANVR